MQRLQKYQLLFKPKQEEDQGKIGIEKILPILQKAHIAQRNKVKFVSQAKRACPPKRSEGGCRIVVV